MKLRGFLLACLFIPSLSTVAQTVTPIDVQHYTFSITLNDADNNIQGKAGISTLVNTKTDMITFDLAGVDTAGKGMQVSSVLADGRVVRFKQANNKLTIFAAAKAKSKHTYTIAYSGTPSDGLIISTNKYGDRTFFGDNWLRRARKWLPCNDDVADKAGVDFIVTAPAHYSVVANGIKLSEKQTGNSKTTHWHEAVPVSTKVMVIGVANFAISKPVMVNNIPVNAYTFKQDSTDGFKAYACAAEVLQFYINKIGPFSYKKLANVQSKTIFGGMENASNIFYYENSVNDEAIEALVAHEVAHQWFGDAATETNVANVWLSEGFATYLTHYYHENKYGTDSLKKRMAADRETIFKFEASRHTPVIDTTTEKEDITLLNPNSYQKGSWVLHMLRRKLGDDAFWKGIRTYYARYRDGNANTDSLKAIMQKAGNQNLTPFFKQWLYTPGHPQVKITYTVDADKQITHLHIEQQQTTSFAFPLQIKAGGKVFTIEMNERVLNTDISTVANNLIPDPDVNLLAQFEVVRTEK